MTVSRQRLRIQLETVIDAAIGLSNLVEAIDENETETTRSVMAAAAHDIEKISKELVELLIYHKSKS